MNVKDIGKGILAVTITVLVFYSIGLLPNSFWNILATLGVMAIYVKNYNDVEGFLIYSFFFLAILGLLGIFDATFNDGKEGFYVNNMKLVSNNLTAKQCQDACEADRMCKYAVMPLNTSEAFPPKENKCWQSYGLWQYRIGSSGSGYDVWLNKKYKNPITINRTFAWPLYNAGRGSFFSGTVVQTTPSKWDSRLIRYEQFTPMYPYRMNFSAVMKDQGWGNPTWGIYIRLEGMNGETVYQTVLKAPRSIRRVTKRRCRTYPCGKYWSLFGIFSGWGWRTRYCTRCAYYTQSIAGPMIPVSTWIPNLPNKKVRAVRIWAQTRGSGHSLMGSKVSYSLWAQPA